MRNDLADVRLAGRVFAPHFAAPMPYRLALPASLWPTREGRDVVAELSAGEIFEVLEFAGDRAWGRAPGRELVGYLDRDALGDLA